MKEYGKNLETKQSDLLLHSAAHFPFAVSKSYPKDPSKKVEFTRPPKGQCFSGSQYPSTSDGIVMIAVVDAVFAIIVEFVSVATSCNNFTPC